MSTQSRLLNNITNNRFVINESGLVLSCGHEMSRTQFNECNESLCHCGVPLCQNDIAFLRLAYSQQTEVNRSQSVRADSAIPSTITPTLATVPVTELPMIVEELDEYADMPPLVDEGDDEYADMPPLIPYSDLYNEVDSVSTVLDTVEPTISETVEPAVLDTVESTVLETVVNLATSHSVLMTHEGEPVFTDICCGICSETYNVTSNRLAILPCHHVCCSACVSNSAFNKTCFYCRTIFIESDLPCGLIPPVSTDSFESALADNFLNYGGPLFHSGLIISQTPNEVIRLQKRHGCVFIPKTVLWVFSNRTALIVRLNPGNNANKVVVMHRWYTIPEQFITVAQARREYSQQCATLSRCASARTYSHAVVDDSSPEQVSVTTYEFVPIVDTPLEQYMSPVSAEQITTMLQSPDSALIGHKDLWLTGLSMVPGAPVLPENTITFANNKPKTVRYVFTNGVGSQYYDLIKCFVRIERDECGIKIPQYMIHTYIATNGLKQDSSTVNRSQGFGAHTGDSRPFRTPHLVHEVIHSQNFRSNPNIQLNDCTLETFSETCAFYVEQGFTHCLDIAAAWPHGQVLSQITGCNPSILLYTTDANGAPIGYNIDPQIHHNSPAVVIGINSLLTSTDRLRSNYVTLGWPVNGGASGSLASMKHAIDGFLRILTARPETLDACELNMDPVAVVAQEPVAAQEPDAAQEPVAAQEPDAVQEPA